VGDACRGTVQVPRTAYSLSAFVLLSFPTNDLRLCGATMLDRNISDIGTTNVLLLGISYPCVLSQMKHQGLDPSILTYQTPSVEQAVECVSRSILTEMDARDLARCVAVEQATNTRVYTVSREVGAIYNDRHIHCDFNTRNFCKKITEKFGRGIQFSQIILDYYWMPTGWLVTRWAKTLFQQTLPDLVRHGMLTFPSTRKKIRKQGTGPPYPIDEGVVFLPFCAHVCKELVGAIHILELYYDISFLDKKDLHGHSLWKGTMQIDPNVMQHHLGKRLDQEEIYCTFRPKDIYESMEDPHVSKPAIMRILLAIQNYDDIRMVRLRPLRQHERANVFRERMWKPEVGGFKGLDFTLSARRLKEQTEIKEQKRNALIASDEGMKEDNTAKVESTKKIKSRKQKKVIRPKVAPEQKKPMDCETEDSPEDQRVEEKEAEQTEKVEERYRFYPGPVHDLETFIDTKKVIAQDLDELKEFRTRQRLGKGTNTSLQKPTRKGVIRLSGNESKLASPCKENLDTSNVKKHGYLLFNPRGAIRGKKDWETENKEWSLDWSIIPEAELQAWSYVDYDTDNDSSNIQVMADPITTTILDLKAASNLYHCILKRFGTPNMPLDGLERVARVQGKDECVQEETGMSASHTM
jgi:hypothetical protein